MCGRYSLVLSDRELGTLFDALWEESADAAWRSTTQVAPTDPAPVARPGLGRRVLQLSRFGWDVPFSRGPLLNARVETVGEKPVFKRALAEGRCVVPASGWFEWERRDGARLPWHFHFGDGRPLLLAGLVQPFRDNAPAQADLFGEAAPRPAMAHTVLTRPAPEPLSRVHGRMPVILDPALAEAWLECTVPPEDLQKLPAGHISVVGERVDTRAGNPRHRPPDLLTPLHDERMTWEC